MKRFVFFGLIILLYTTPQAQSYNTNRIALSNFLTRMYTNQPFEGVKVVQDYENTYLLSVVLVTPSSSESANNRIAQVKCNRQMSQYLGGLTTIDSKTIIKTTESTKTNETTAEITDIIKEHSIGYTRSMEILNIIDLDSGQKCYLFIRNIHDFDDMK